MRVSALVRSLVVAAALVPGIARAQGVTSPSAGTLVWLGGDLTFTGEYKRAAYADYLFLFGPTVDVAAVRATASPLTAFASRFIGNNLPTNPTDHALTFSATFTAAQLTALGLMTGQELVLGLFAQDITRWNFTGAATRNALAGYPNFIAADISCSGTVDCRVAMEDKSQNEMGPGEPDRNDLIFHVTSTPEPGTIGLLATGLLGLAGVAARRRRKA